jgi:methyl-accepting chemotaxis protein WspA
MTLKAFSNKISTRLLLGYCIPLICLAILGVFSHNSAKKIFVLETQRNSLNASSDAANDAAYHLIDAIRKVKEDIAAPGTTHYVAIYRTNYSSFLRDIEALKALAAKHSDPAQKELAEKLADEGTRINNEVQKIFAELENKNLGAVSSLAADLGSDSVSLNRAELLNHLRHDLEENTAEFKLAQQQLTQILMGGTALAALTTMGVGLWVSQQIRRQMNQIVGVVEQNGIQVTTSSTQISASSRQLEASVTEQVAATTQITATATEIAATAEELTHTIERVSGLSEAAATTASTGKQDLERMVQTIQQLIAATATISSKLGLIDTKANSISTVVTAIAKVADQTNLLSLNAAIEAEKAGEYGAGFSVVAREIRRLADQTAIATLDIETLVKDMLSSVSAGVMEMDKFTQDVGNNAENISQISEQMAQIIYQVQSLVPQFETVSDGMLAQAQGAQQIKAAMEQLNETSQQTADSVKDTHQVILQLSDVAQDLRSEVAHFRLAV